MARKAFPVTQSGNTRNRGGINNSPPEFATTDQWIEYTLARTASCGTLAMTNISATWSGKSSRGGMGVAAKGDQQQTGQRGPERRAEWPCAGAVPSGRLRLG